MIVVKEWPANTDFSIGHQGPLRVIGFYFVPDPPQTQYITVTQDVLRYQSNVPIPGVRQQGQMRMTYVLDDDPRHGTMESHFYVRSVYQVDIASKEVRPLFVAYNPSVGAALVLYRQRPIRGLSKGDTCMWCGVGPFPDDVTLEEHEDGCTG